MHRPGAVGEDGAAVSPISTHLVPSTGPQRLPGLQRAERWQPCTQTPESSFVLSAVSCVQEELTSTSVEHFVINPNAAFEKFKDKRLGTKGVGEPRGPGKGELWSLGC